MADLIRVVVFREGDLWVAQCLEYDIGAQAADLDTLRGRLTAVVSAELRESMNRHGEPFKGIPEAPSYFERLWSKHAGFLTQDGVAPGVPKPPVNIQYALCA